MNSCAPSACDFSFCFYLIKSPSISYTISFFYLFFCCCCWKPTLNLARHWHGCHGMNKGSETISDGFKAWDHSDCRSLNWQVFTDKERQSWRFIVLGIQFQEWIDLNVWIFSDIKITRIKKVTRQKLERKSYAKKECIVRRI